MTNEVPKEQDGPHLADIAEQNLKNFLKDATIGTPKLLAFSDELNRKSLRSQIDFTLKDFDNAPHHVSFLRTMEFQIAILDLQIDNRKVTIPGYAAASSKASKLISDVEKYCVLDRLQETSGSNKTEWEDEQLRGEAEDQYLDIVWNLYRSATGDSD